MPSTDLLNPVTPVLGGAALSSANALPVTVISSGAAGASSLIVGSTPVSSGSTTRILYDNGGVLGEYTLSGAGTAVAMAQGPTFSSVVAFADSGTWSSAGIAVSAGSTIGFAGRTLLTCTLDSTLLLTNNAGTSFAGIYLGGTSSAFSLLLTNGILSTFRKGDNASDANLAAGALTLSSTLTYGGVTFASTATGSGSLVGGTNPSVSSLVITGTMTYGGVTYASTVTGTGSNVLATGPTLSSLTATGTLTYGGVTLASTVTGTGSMVLATAPTFPSTSTVTFTAGATINYGGVAWGSAVTGTGSNVLAAGPTFTGSAGFTSLSATGIGTFANGVAPSASTVTVGLQLSSTASMGIIFSGIGSVVPTMAATQGCLLINTTGSSTATRMFIKASAAGTWTNFTTAA